MIFLTFRFQPLIFSCVLYRICGMPRNSAEWHPVCSTQGPRSTSSDDARPPRNSYWWKTESGRESILLRCTYIVDTIIFDALIYIYIHMYIHIMMYIYTYIQNHIQYVKEYGTIS